METTVDYVHAKGLGFGLYGDRGGTDPSARRHACRRGGVHRVHYPCLPPHVPTSDAGAGTLDCAKNPGALGHEQKDAEFMARYQVDWCAGKAAVGSAQSASRGAHCRYKEDSCYASGDQETVCGGLPCHALPTARAQSCPRNPQAIEEYATMRDALNQTGRPIWFALCGWEPWYCSALCRITQRLALLPSSSFLPSSLLPRPSSALLPTHRRHAWRRPSPVCRYAYTGKSLANSWRVGPGATATAAAVEAGRDVQSSLLTSIDGSVRVGSVADTVCGWNCVMTNVMSALSVASFVGPSAGGGGWNDMCLLLTPGEGTAPAAEAGSGRSTHAIGTGAGVRAQASGPCPCPTHSIGRSSACTRSLRPTC